MCATIIHDARLAALVEVDGGRESGWEKISGGCIFTEGPVWSHQDNSLIFSDIQGDTLYRWTAASGLTTFRRPSGQANGNTYDVAGRLISCEHQNRRVSRTLADGTVETLVNGVYRVSARDGAVSVVATDFERPNGLVISTDGRQILID